MRTGILKVAVLVPMLLVSGCSTAYYAAWKKLGYEKRDILVSRVKDARNDQQAAKEQFQTTLQRFRAVTGTADDTLPSHEYDRVERWRIMIRARPRAKAVHEPGASGG